MSEARVPSERQMPTLLGWARELVSAEPIPPILHHYTDRRGLLGITKENHLWLTSIHYLNDTEEYRLAYKKFYEFLSSKKGAFGEPWQNEIVDKALLACKVPETKHPYHRKIYLFSFSQDGNVLSQWRAYGRPSDRVSLGFDAKIILSEQTHSTFLARCRYKNEEHFEVFEAVLRGAFREYELKRDKPVLAEYRWISIAVDGMFDVMKQAATLVKHEAFEEEQEWRLVVIRENTYEGILVREGSGVLIPYVEYPIPVGVASPVKGVMVGPSPRAGDEERAIHHLLYNAGIDCPVTLSGIPFR